MTAVHAAVAAVRRHHGDHGVPPWKPYVRLSVRQATVMPYLDSEEEQMMRNWKR